MRARGRKRKTRMPPSHFAHECVVLAVDPATACGWSWLVRGEVQASGALDGYDARAIGRLIRDVLAAAAHKHALPAVLVLEKPPTVLYDSESGRSRSLAGAGSVIGCRKLWYAEWVRAGGVQKRVVDVQPPTWRAGILGNVRGLKGAQLKALALHRVNMMGLPVSSSDEAEAILIGVWAARAGEVLAVLPKKRKVVA